MGFHLSPYEKRDIANELLLWLKKNRYKTWANNHDLLSEFATDKNHHLFDVWKAFYLLRDLGRIKLNNPNGRKGSHVISYTELEKPIKTTRVICSFDTCPIIQQAKILLANPRKEY